MMFIQDIIFLKLDSLLQKRVFKKKKHISTIRKRNSPSFYICLFVHIKGIF